MPLTVRRRPDTGRLEIAGTVRPAGAKVGVRVRQRAGTDDAALAGEEARALEASILREAWHGPRAQSRSFAAAVAAYLRHQDRSAGTIALADRLLRHFADTPCAAIDQEAVDRARAALLRPGARPGTVRRNLIVPLTAILTFASRRKWCEAPAFDAPEVSPGRTVFLLPDQAEALIAAANPHLAPLLRFLVCTGCRLGEALALRWDQVDLPAGRALLWEGETKSGARRVVALPPAAVAAMAGLRWRDGPVFRAAHERPYATAEGGRGDIGRAWARACRDAGLPGAERRGKRYDRCSGTVLIFVPEHTPHCLRHSWASWHYALHRDLLLLKRDGGWSSVALVERYAHLMPAGQEAAIRRAWGLWPADTMMRKG